MRKALLILYFFTCLSLVSQNDCSDAIIVCGNSGYSDLAVAGIGTQELSPGSNTCSSQENNSIWFKLLIKTGGTLGFTLTPNNSSINEDFDFFIFGPNVNCGNIGTAIRCSTTNPAAAGQGNNLTGLKDTESDTSEGPGPSGNSFVRSLTVNAGDSYFLVIDRPIGSSNFDLTWTGTATFDEPPTVNTTILPGNTLDIDECDNDGDGKAVFNLNINDAIIGSQPNIVATYHESSNDAILNINPISNSGNYTNVRNPQTIYIRLTNTITECFEVRDFSLNATAIPAFSTPTSYEVCDDMSSGSDIDGIASSFILASKDAEILGSISSSQYAVSYHKSLIGAQTSASTDVIDKNIPYQNTTANEEKIYIRVQNRNNSSCFTTSEDTSTTFKPLKLVVNPLPNIINNPAIIKQCDVNADLTSLVNLVQAQVKISNNSDNETFNYYPTELDAINGTNIITNPFTYNATTGDTVWARTISDKGCYRISEIEINISFSGVLPYNEEFTACDDFLDIDGNDTANNDDTDGITNFDISRATPNIKNLFPSAVRNDLDVVFFETSDDRDVIRNPIGGLYTSYRNKNIPANTRQPIYYKVINRLNQDCAGIGEFYIFVQPVPEFTITSPQILCLNNSSLIIEAELPNGNFNYEWTRDNDPTIIGRNASLTIIRGGNYTVTAINPTTFCKKSKTIIVNESIIASVNQNDVTIVDDAENNSITLNNSGSNLGIGDYEFALQDERNQIIIDFQDAPIFENLKGGIYTILIRDKNDCGIARLEVSVLEFPDFFTPNNDGINDVWNVKGTNSFYYPSGSIAIFDRYGKIITSFKVNEQGWDGLYNGKNVPSNDYWFNIELTNRNGRTITRKGHFSLLRK